VAVQAPNAATAAYRLAQALAERSDRPCILLEPAQDAHHLCRRDARVIRLPPQALPPLLLQAHAFHHGGVGSCAKSGGRCSPILIPRAYDQFENAKGHRTHGRRLSDAGSLRHAPSDRPTGWSREAASPRSARPSAYSTPHRPNTAVVAALRHLTAD
jgi:hypothetical protein